jgi:1,4-alpha-glucan branching enzyme
MISKKRLRNGHVRVTFAVPDPGEPVAVVADLNDWNASTHPMKRRSNGTRSVTIEVPAGQEIRFRYATAGGAYFDDADADGLEPNGFGETHTIVLV